ncbi:MAG: SulP family inorganic anion transporter [Steroidobacteraceae bacterium]
MIAIVEAYRARLLTREYLPANLVAGLIVGIVALPLAMAFAIASGVKPEQGIYSAIVAGLVVSLFGGSRIQVAGPTGAFIVILAGITARHGVDGLLVATLMAGVILILLGAAKFGGVIRFIPDPVIVGFTAGIGVIIWVGQWRDFFGLPRPAGEQFYAKLYHLLVSLPQLHLATTGLAAMPLALAILSPRIPLVRKAPGPLVAMVAATALQSAFAFPGVATIGSAFGGIPVGLPGLSLPLISFDRMMELLPSAFTIAMLGAIESLLSAVVADGMAGTHHDSNQELIGQGVANVIAPLFGGIAVTGAIARTATNFRNGANSPVAGVVHALTLALVLLVASPLAARIPLCSLAAILFFVAWNMSDLKRFARMVRTAPRADVIILLITFTLTIVTDLVVAVNIGVILAMLHFLRRMSSSVDVVTQSEEHLRGELGHGASARLPKGVLVYAVEGPLFFGAVDNFERALKQTHTDPKFVIIRLGRVPFMDITGIQALELAIQNLTRRGVRVLICEASERVHGKLTRAEILPETDAGPGTGNRYFAELDQAVAWCRTQS